MSYLLQKGEKEENHTTVVERRVRMAPPLSSIKKRRKRQIFGVQEIRNGSLRKKIIRDNCQ